MNKYQEALDHLCKYEIAYKVSCKESIDTLQELIDKQECFELYFSENHKKSFNEFFERWKKGDE